MAMSSALWAAAIWLSLSSRWRCTFSSSYSLSCARYGPSAICDSKSGLYHSLHDKRGHLTLPLCRQTDKSTCMGPGTILPRSAG